MRKFFSLEDMVAASAEGVRPPERLSVSEAAHKYRYLDNPGSYIGYWDNDFAPYLIEPMDTLTSTEHDSMIFTGPARTGKSDMFFNWLGHTAKCDPSDMMLVHMTQNTGRDWSQGDLRKMFRHSKEIGALVVPGRQNMNVHDVRFLSGMRLLIKWPTISELSGKTSRYNWLMDYDRMPEDVDKEGTPFALTKKRAQTFGRYGMTVAESSPGFEVTNPKWMAKSPHEAPPTKGILALYNTGDRRRWYWRCLHCGQAFEPDFHLLRYPDTKDKIEAAEAAVLPCPFCDFEHKHEMKKELNIAGRWLKDGQRWTATGKIIGEAVRSDTASFWLKGPAAAFQTWRGLVLNYLTAMEEYENTGAQESLKTTINVDQGLPFAPLGLYDNQRQPEQLKARAEDVPLGVVPSWVRFLIATIDIQRNRFVVQVHGHGPGHEGAFGDVCVIDRFEIRKSKRLDEDGERMWVNPATHPEDWRLLIKQVLLKAYPLADGSGRHMQIKAMGYDSGGEGKKDQPISTTTNAYAFWRYLRDGPLPGEESDDGWEPGLHTRVLPMKGDGKNRSAPRVQVRYPDSERKDRHAAARGEIPVLFINSNQVKDAVSNMLGREEPGGGMIRFPVSAREGKPGLPDSFYAELTVEVRGPKGWENPSRARNESWDLLCYDHAVCLSRLVGIEHIRWDEPPGWAAPWDENDLVIGVGEDRRFSSKPVEDKSLSDLGSSLA